MWSRQFWRNIYIWGRQIPTFWVGSVWITTQRVDIWQPGNETHRNCLLAVKKILVQCVCPVQTYVFVYMSAIKTWKRKRGATEWAVGWLMAASCRPYRWRQKTGTSLHPSHLPISPFDSISPDSRHLLTSLTLPSFSIYLFIYFVIRRHPSHSLRLYYAVLPQ